MMTLVYFAWRLASFLVGLLPLRACTRFADVLGIVVYWLMPGSRRNAAANYAQVMGKAPGDPAVRRVTKRAFRNFCAYLLDVMRFPTITESELNRRVVLYDTEVFRQALAEKRGAIFVSAHFGAMDLAGVKLARQFAPLTLAAEVLKAKRLYEWLVANRARHRVKMIPYQQAARALLKALHDNEFIGFFLDLGTRYDHKGVPVRFFGATAYFPAAPALVAHRTGSPLIMGYAVIGEDGLIHGHTFPIIHGDPSLEREAFVHTVTQQLATYMEQFIAQYPEQWYIFRRIWPDQPLPAAAPASHAASARSMDGAAR